MQPFRNREEAGKLLAGVIAQHPAYKHKPLLVGVARGGVVAAAEIAQLLQLPFLVLVVKKIGAPFNPELALGAITHEKTVYWEEHILAQYALDKKTLGDLVEKKSREVALLSEALFKNEKMEIPPNRTVILVDDGVATGATVLCAQKYLQKKHVAKIYLATPVIARDVHERLRKTFIDIVSLVIAEKFYAVGEFYQEFPEVDTKDVQALLQT